MKISVIIPTYNRAKHLQTTLESVKNQTCKVDEILIVDDGSSDETQELLEHEDITYLYQENTGVSSARNLGLKHAKHDWIAFLDSDDTWHERKIEIQKDLHVKHPDILASFCDELWIREGKEIKLKSHQEKIEPTFLNSLRLCKIGTSTFFAHKSVFEEVGDFDETLRACEDYDLWLRILQKFHISYIPQKLTTKYAGHENQLSFITPFIDIYRIEALKKHLSSKYKKEVLQEIDYKLSILKKGATKHQNTKILNYCDTLFKELNF